MKMLYVTKLPQLKAVSNENLKEKYFDDMKIQYYLRVTIVFPLLV